MGSGRILSNQIIHHIPSILVYLQGQLTIIKILPFYYMYLFIYLREGAITAFNQGLHQGMPQFLHSRQLYTQPRAKEILLFLFSQVAQRWPSTEEQWTALHGVRWSRRFRTQFSHSDLPQPTAAESGNTKPLFILANWLVFILMDRISVSAWHIPYLRKWDMEQRSCTPEEWIKAVSSLAQEHAIQFSNGDDKRAPRVSAT